MIGYRNEKMSALSLVRRLVIYFTPMRNTHDAHLLHRFVDEIHHAPVSDPNPPLILPAFPCPSNYGVVLLHKDTLSIPPATARNRRKTYATENFKRIYVLSKCIRSRKL